MAKNITTVTFVQVRNAVETAHVVRDLGIDVSLSAIQHTTAITNLNAI